MKKVEKILLILVFMLVLIIVVGLIDFKINIDAVSNESKELSLEITEKETYYSLGKVLKEKNLIKSEFWYKVYIKLTSPKNLQQGFYILNQNMNLKEIINELEKGSTYDPNVISITFKEGLNIRKIAKILDEKTDNTYDDVIKQVSDTEYIKNLINEYWFLTDDILNSKIYYPLEGYLFPETYKISTKNSVEEIFSIMLKQTDKILTKYKENLENSDLSIHEIMTLSSIVELEASNADDRKGVAGVFYNRLNSNGWTLGSDVTTYYALKIDDFKTPLTDKIGLKDCSTGYNTRCPSMKGLPVGPIANSGEESIEAVINPSSHNYYYFVADCSGKTYLNSTANGHALTISQLKSQGNWCA